MTVPGSIAAVVEQEARGLGFHLAGITPVPEPGAPSDFPELSRFSQWIAEGRSGSMEYLQRQDSSGAYLRSSLRVPFPWARSVIVCAVTYNAAEPVSTDPAPQDAGWIARYAWSGRPNDEETLEPTDYHSVIRDRLENLADCLRERLGSFQYRCFVDTGPVVERIYAKYAGLGWQGKNTCLINEKIGSWFFLGVVVTSLELSLAERPATMPDRCGSCTRCIDACPTQCLEPYQMDASRCIAYLTIENRGEIAEELRPAIGRNVFGCDICQEVCPWNRKAPITDWPELTARPELVNPTLEWLENLEEEQYRYLFRKSPVARTKHAAFKRNVAIAKHNQTAQVEKP